MVTTTDKVAVSNKCSIQTTLWLRALGVAPQWTGAPIKESQCRVNLVRGGSKLRIRTISSTLLTMR